MRAELRLILECDPAYLDLLRAVAAAAGTPVHDGSQGLEMEFDHVTWESEDPTPPEASDTWATARAWVSTVNGALSLRKRYSGDPPVRLRQAYYLRGTKTPYLPIGASLFLDRWELELEQREPELTERCAEYLKAAAADSEISKVLRLISYPPDWITLYKIFEIVKKDCGGETELCSTGWIDEATCESFRKSANFPEATGDSARHGTESGRAVDPMDVRMARHHIRRVARNWLNWRCGT